MKKIINPWHGLEDQGYNCFGCAPSNPYGLKMEFYEDGDDVVSYWHPSDNFQGWLHTLHGGIQSTIIDEIAMWVIARKLQTSGMTTNLNVKFRKPVPTGEGGDHRGPFPYQGDEAQFRDTRGQHNVRRGSLLFCRDNLFLLSEGKGGFGLLFQRLQGRG